MDYVFICSWPHGEEKGGVAQYAWDAGQLSYLRTLDEEVSFGTAFVNQEKNVLYALNETSRVGGGYVYSYKLHPETGAVEKLGETPTFCLNPAYLAVAPGGKFAVVANHSYSGPATTVERDKDGKYHAVLVQNDAAVELFAIGEDGMLGELLDVVKHTGCSVGPRQNMPHPHCAVFSPDGQFFAVCDKGNDRIYTYKIDREHGKLLQAWEPLQVRPGSMPRYACFHPTQPFFYHNNEGSEWICAYRWDASGSMTPVGEYSVLPASGGGTARLEQQGLCMHPSGKYLYDAVNGAECVAVFEIDQHTGALTLVQNMETGSKWTRGIALAPDARRLIATGLKGGDVLVCDIAGDGRLVKTLEYDQSNASFAAFWQAQTHDSNQSEKENTRV